MKIYQPLLLPRRTYRSERDRRPFRNAVFQVISRLNPSENKLLFDYHDPQLNMKRWHFSVNPAAFQQQAATEVQKAARAMILTNEALVMLDKVKSERGLEESQRWRAAYDLSYAQLLTFRLRLYQYLLTIDDHVRTGRRPKKEKTNEWNLTNRRKPIIPNEDQYSAIAKTFKLKQSREEYLTMAKEGEDRAKAMLRAVIKEHPGTPWAQRAQTELGRGLGHQFNEGFRDPRYDTMRAQIKVPSL